MRRTTLPWLVSIIYKFACRVLYCECVRWVGQAGFVVEVGECAAGAGVPYEFVGIYVRKTERAMISYGTCVTLIARVHKGSTTAVQMVVVT